MGIRSFPQTSSDLPTLAELRPMIEPYARPRLGPALWQLATTLPPYLICWFLMWRSLSISYALTLLLAIPTAAFYARMFIIFHDCGHNSFFPSVKANKRVGFWLGVLLFFPGEEWWHAHAIHHATSSNLDKRGIGDVETWTVNEYRQASWWRKAGYRIFRYPPVMLGLGPIAMFLLVNRFPVPRFGKKETLSVLWADLAIAAMIGGVSWLIGWKAYVMIQLPLVWAAGAVGIWMFYIQHQFPDMYWAPNDQWNYVASALRGASYYRLPALLQWATGNIGFHHIHHLSPRIPSYELEACYRANPTLQACAKTIRFGEGYHCLTLKLWDEVQQKMVGFNDLKVGAEPAA